MSEQNKDNLENFFRKRTRHHNIEFDEADWLKLEKQLDQEMPIAFSLLDFIKKFWIILLLLLVLPTAWYYFDHISPAKINNASSDVNVEYTNKSRVSSEEATTLEPASTAHQAQSDNRRFSNSSLELNDDKSRQNIASIIHNQSSVNNDAIRHVQKHANETTTKDLGYAVLEDGAKSNDNIMDFRLHFLSAITPSSSINASGYYQYLEKETPEELSPIKIGKSMFSVGVGYSPDFSTVGIGNFVSPGSRWSVIAEYGISNRFSVNTGIVLVNNKYEAYGEDYHAPSRYWKKGIIADEAFGECKMIDIPINLRYNFLIKGKNMAFLSAGASTYFVLKEDYYFHYDQEDPELPDHWGTDKMTTYPFGIINFSLGYQYQVNRRSSFQFEPFIKIPTTGIGWGNVDLHTMGVYFMYKYVIGK